MFVESTPQGLAAPGKPRVLCVDDEAEILAGLSLILRREFTVLCASSGAQALALLEQTENVAVVVSDMKMPELDGAGFLSRVRLRWPDITRILLTGEGGRGPAVAAVNEGQIFRFLTKPCSAPDLIAAVAAGHRQYQLVTSEKILLQQTLVGSIQALVDLMGMVNPVAFGRAGRVKRLALELYKQLGNPPSWELEAAALLSQIGYASIPADIVDRLYVGKPLSPKEAAMATDATITASRLLARIPRLDRVAAILEIATANVPQSTEVFDDLSVRAAVLAVVLEIDLLVSRGETPSLALPQLHKSPRRHSAALLEALSNVIGDTGRSTTIKELALRDVKQGMILLTDVHLDNGALLVSQDYEISESFIQRLNYFKPSLLNKTVRVGLRRNYGADHAR